MDEKLPIPISASNIASEGSNGIVAMSNGVAESVTIGSNLVYNNHILKTTDDPAFAQIEDTTMGPQTAPPEFGPFLGNVAIGTSALNHNMTGYANVAVGHNALTLITSGSANTALGALTLSNNTNGTGNVGVGGRSLVNTNGLFNTAIGLISGFSDRGGTFNTYIGFNSCADPSVQFNGDNNTYIGSETRCSGQNVSYENVLTANTTGKGNDTTIIKSFKGLYTYPVALAFYKYTGLINTPTTAQYDVRFPLVLQFNATTNISLENNCNIRLNTNGIYKFTFTAYFVSSTTFPVIVQFLSDSSLTGDIDVIDMVGTDVNFTGTISFISIVISTNNFLKYFYSTPTRNPQSSFIANISILVEYLGLVA